jgi:hypothetical protein
MALTVGIATAIAMSTGSREGSRLWLFEAKDPRQDNSKLKLEVRSNSYPEALESANEVKLMYHQDGIDLEWIVTYELDPGTKNKIAVVYKKSEIGVENTTQK